MFFNYNSDIKSCINTFILKEMINGIDEAKNICDKDIILGLYYSLYNMIIPPLELMNENVSKEYSEYFNKTMNTVIRLSKSRKDNVSAESFIGNFLYYLDNNEFSKVYPISNIISLFKKDLKTFINVERNISNNFLLVDKEFTLEEKVAISIQYKKYISDLYIVITSIYGVSETENLLDKLKKSLDLDFPELLCFSNDMDRLDGEIRKHVKNMLVDISNYNEFDFYGDNSQFAYNLIQLLNEDEIKVFKLYYLYKLAGFEGNHFITMGINNNTMALELGMDKETFTKAFKNISKKSKMMHLKQRFGFGKTRKKIK